MNTFIRLVVDQAGKVLLFWAGYQLAYHRDTYLEGSSFAAFGVLAVLAGVLGICIALYGNDPIFGPIGVLVGLVAGVILTLVVVELELVWWQTLIGCVAIVLYVAHSAFMAMGFIGDAANNADEEEIDVAAVM